MAKVLMEIDLGNDAMQTGEDIANALRKVSLIIEKAPIEEGFVTIIRDENGNNVGILRIVAW